MGHTHKDYSSKRETLAWNALDHRYPEESTLDTFKQNIPS